VNNWHPSLASENPGVGVKLKLQKTSGDFQIINLADILESAFINKGYEVVNEGLCIRIVGTDFIVTPTSVKVAPKGNGWSTTTTIQVDSQLAFQKPIFEFQHESADQPIQSILKGFQNWIDYELSVLLDVIEENPENSAGVAFRWQTAKGAEVRKVTFGPIIWFRMQPNNSILEPTGHLFCRCCMYNDKRISGALAELLRSERVYGIKLFAFRDQDGMTSADCRVNGVAYNPGKSALLEYAKQWAQNGSEYRKQYLSFHTVSSGTLSENWQKL